MRKRTSILITLILILILMLAGCGAKHQAADTADAAAPETKAYKIETIRGEIFGVEEPVTLADGSQTTAIVFDNAATTPAFKDVNDEVIDKLAMYGYAGSGKGQKSAAVAAVYEETRKTVLDFVNADPELYTAFFCSNTTDGINKLSSALVTDEGDMVLSSRMEHYANDLPWRHRGNTIYAEVDEKGRLRLDEMERLLAENPIKYVSVTAATNVTGYINDVHTLARMAHEHGALIVVDGAQIVPHRAFSMMGETPEENIDFFVFSAHKMYAPYGGGAVVGLKSELDEHIPRFYGAGITQEVSDDKETYLAAPSLYEAGSHNYTGIVAMKKAIEIMEDIGYDNIQQHEQVLLRKVIDGLQAIDGVTVYGDTEKIDDKIGIVTFNIDNVWYTDAAAALAENAGIDVGKGTFGAQPYVFRLLGLPNLEIAEDEDDAYKIPGMLRVSFGIYNTEEEVDTFLEQVREMAK